METTALTFGAPHWLWALLVLPLIAGLFLWSHRRGQALVAKIVAVRLRDQLSGSVSPLRRILRASLLLVSLALAIVSLAQPRKQQQHLVAHDLATVLDETHQPADARRLV